MIICTHRADAEAHDTITITPTAAGYRIENAERALRFEFDLSAVSFGPDILYLSQNAAGGIVKTWASETANSRDGHAAAHGRQYGQAVGSPVCAIAIEPGKAAAHVATIYGVISPAPNVVIDSQVTSTDRLLDRNVSAMRPFIAKMWTKSRLLAQVNTQDSLAALEQQLDLITALLASLYDPKNPALPDWAPAFFEAMASSSSLTLTQPAAAIEKAGTFKRALRALQATYFKAVGRG
jgi:hypothetical protein